MIQNSKLPLDLSQELKTFSEEWESFALKVLKQKAIHVAPRFVLVYDLETTREFEPKFHGFLCYDIDENRMAVYGLIPARFEKDVTHYVQENGEWLEVYRKPRHWAEVMQAIFQKPEEFAVMIGANLLNFDLQKSDLQIGEFGKWKIDEERYSYQHDEGILNYRRIISSHLGHALIRYNFDLLPLATKVGFQKGQKKVEQLANALNTHFFKMPNPPTFLQPALSIEEINYCINDCLIELELFAHLSNRILKQAEDS